MSSLRRTLTALSLSVLVSGLPLLASSGGIVTPMAGTVAVNGEPVAAGSAILPGDQVMTSASGSARLVLPGASLVAAAQTRFRMESAAGAPQVRLSSGLLEVSGDLPVVVAAHTVAPTDARVRFNVYDHAGEVYVTAVAGALTVKSARGVVPVAAGTTVTFGQQALPAPVALKTGVSPAAVAAMVVAAAAATGAAVYFIEHKKTNTVSPSSL